MEAHSFGHWLRLKRKGRDLTREGLAARVGCSAATIQKLEDEERRPSEHLAARLADVFDIPTNEQSAFLRFARGQLQPAFAVGNDARPWNSPPERTRSTLPIPFTSFVGREAELQDLHCYLLTPGVRLVTIFGPPGVGKTRLSVEAARPALAHFPDGVFFAPLASVAEPNLLSLAVARTLGYVAPRNVMPHEILRDGIGDKRLLVVLDNCEHLVEAVASFVAWLLAVCPHLCFLATSREPLCIAGEWLYPLPALTVPASDWSSRAERASDVTSKFPVLSLFADRVRAVQPDFRLSADNVELVSAICRKLDGLPLAVELVAARIRSMSAQELLDRLGSSPLSIAQGMRGVPERQQSLTNAIVWSHGLLSEHEQTLFAFLSVFGGSFTLRSAQVLFGRAFNTQPVPHLLDSLSSKSLVQRRIDLDGETRYMMLETIREFARQRLHDSGAEVTARDWHLGYFLEAASHEAGEIRGPRQLDALDKLDAHRGDFHAALGWAIESEQVESALQLAHALWWFWSMRSEFNEGRQWIERVLQLPGARSFHDPYAAVLTQSAHHTFLQGRTADAKPVVEEALALARAYGGRQTVANALMVLGLVLTVDEKFADARSAFEESLGLCLASEDQWGHALLLMSLSYLAYRQNDEAMALTLCGRALTAFRALGDRYFQSVCLYEAGSLRAKRGDWAGGLAEIQKSLGLARELRSNFEIASGLFRLAEIEQHLGQLTHAVLLYYAARTAYESIGAWLPQDDATLEPRITFCRNAIGGDAFLTAKSEGEAMTLVQAIENALATSSVN